MPAVAMGIHRLPNGDEDGTVVDDIAAAPLGVSKELTIRAGHIAYAYDKEDGNKIWGDKGERIVSDKNVVFSQFNRMPKNQPFTVVGFASLRTSYMHEQLSSKEIDLASRGVTKTMNTSGLPIRVLDHLAVDPDVTKYRATPEGEIYANIYVVDSNTVNPRERFHAQYRAACVQARKNASGGEIKGARQKKRYEKVQKCFKKFFDKKDNFEVKEARAYFKTRLYDEFNRMRETGYCLLTHKSIREWIDAIMMVDACYKEELRKWLVRKLNVRPALDVDVLTTTFVIASNIGPTETTCLLYQLLERLNRDAERYYIGQAYNNADPGKYVNVYVGRR